MGYYLFVAFLLYVLGNLEIGANSSVKKFVAVLSAIILIIFAGLKTDGGTDLLEYTHIYNLFTSFKIKSFIEPGYQILMLVFHAIGCSFITYYFFVACINISIKASVFYKLAPCISAAFLIYFCGCFFERDNDGIRQGLSMSFCFLALYYLSIEKNIRYLIITLIAVSIHYSSIAFFAAYFFKKIKWNDKLIAIIIGASFILSILGQYLTSYLLPMVSMEMAAKKLEIYSSNSNSEELGISIGLIFRTLILFLFMIYRKQILIHNNLFYLLRNGLAFSIICTLLFGDFGIIAHRLPYVFREFQIFIISYLIAAIPSKIGKMIGLATVFAYTCIVMSRFFSDDSVYNNYQNFLFQ